MQICHELFELQMGRQAEQLSASQKAEALGLSANLTTSSQDDAPSTFRQHLGYYLIRLGQRLVRPAHKA